MDKHPKITDFLTQVVRKFYSNKERKQVVDHIKKPCK